VGAAPFERALGCPAGSVVGMEDLGFRKVDDDADLVDIPEGLTALLSGVTLERGGLEV
jgi:hypothetical protein